MSSGLKACSTVLASVLSAPVSAVLLVPCESIDELGQSGKSAGGNKSAAPAAFVVWLACDDGCLFILDPAVRRTRLAALRSTN